MWSEISTKSLVSGSQKISCMISFVIMYKLSQQACTCNAHNVYCREILTQIENPV